ncbi:MAG: hypothetical protein JW746_05945 [Candidatus Krumholzibacteriota bacterium]|nr:hypothetical protein [Candidatus Krumholzibacteriota bacterium]
MKTEVEASAIKRAARYLWCDGTKSAFCAVVIFAYAACLVIAGFVLPHFDSIQYDLFGFSQLSSLEAGHAVIILCFLVVFLLIYGRFSLRIHALAEKIEKALFSKTIHIIILGILCVILFLLLRNNFINYDGRAFAEKFHRDVAATGAHVTHDEMWELYVHSRFWYYTNRFWGWSVTFSYQVMSSIAGGAFIFFLLRFCKKLLPSNPLGLFLIIISGGYMQIFFGDVENYTLTAIFILLYFCFSLAYIRDRRHIALPSSILAVAMTFHLLAGFLLPSLAFLYWLELKKRHYREIWSGIASFVLIIGLTLLFFHLKHLPISDLFWRSHAFGHGGHILRMLARPSVSYYLKIFNLLFLLVPALILVVPLLLFGLIEWDDFNIYMAVACVFMMGYIFIWEARLGVYNDWNMFANVSIPFSIFTGYNLLKGGKMKVKTKILVSLVLLFIIHSYTWIVSNHFTGS